MSALRILAVLLCVLAAPAYAQVQGQDYRLLTPAQPPASPGKVEVIEFFSYGCPHCYALQSHIVKWAAELPANVSFVRVPVSFGRREWGQLSRAYYALEATGDLPRLDDALFEGIHKEHKRLFDEDTLAAWAAEHGVEAAKFRAAFESPGVSAQAMRAEQLSREYKVNSVPYLIVDGKYIVLGQTHEEMLKIARQLVDKSAKSP
jgi:protein dithiol oxidoreductase (disulfide-forming)